MDAYLNDHLAGAMVGSKLARQIERRAAGTSLGEVMSWLAPEIEEDRLALIDLMQRIGSPRGPVKQAGGWVAGKAARVTFAGLTASSHELGAFMALESLALGVMGKASLWDALRQVADVHPALGSLDLDGLSRRARRQYEALERERLGAAKRVLRG